LTVLLSHVILGQKGKSNVKLIYFQKRIETSPKY